MYKITVPVRNFIDCFNFYNYEGSYITTFSGFVQPKEEFEEWFQYLKVFRPDSTCLYNFNEILSPQILSYKLTNSNYLFGDYDVFDFEFPDEETALYFKMKYCS